MNTLKRILSTLKALFDSTMTIGVSVPNKPVKHKYKPITKIKVQMIESILLHRPNTNRRGLAYDFDTSLSTIYRIVNKTHHFSTKD